MMKTTFILIHGSWHSAWNWHKVSPRLIKRGFEAMAVDLPGMGRDRTPIESVTLQTSVQKIVDLIDSIEGRIVLVGHSKNGIVISQAAEHRPHRIEKLVYLAAYLVPNGKTQREYSMQDTEGVLKPYVHLHPELNATTLDPAIYCEGLYADCDRDITELAKVLLSHEPVALAITPLQLNEENFGSVPRYYIECTEDRAVTPFIQRKMYTESLCRKVYSLPSSHSPFFSMPDELVAILHDIAEDEKEADVRFQEQAGVIVP